MPETSMQLRDFITETLVQIVDGVITAQENVKGKNAYISPGNIISDNKLLKATFTRGRSPIVQNIEFDVAITATESDETKGGVGVVAAIVNAGVQHTVDTKSGSISHIKFSIPIVLPEQWNT